MYGSDHVVIKPTHTEATAVRTSTVLVYVCPCIRGMKLLLRPVKQTVGSISSGEHIFVALFFTMIFNTIAPDSFVGTLEYLFSSLELSVF